MRILFLILFCFSLSFSAIIKTQAPGVITGYQPIDEAQRMSSAWYTMKRVIPAAITSDTIKTDSLFGAGFICRQIMNRTKTDGRVNARDTKGTEFIAIPIAAEQTTVILPSITKILKSGTTIDTLILFLQVQDTIRR
jgi:hypothetical protein